MPRRRNKNGGGNWTNKGPATPSVTVATFPERIKARLGYVTSGTLVAAVSASQVWNANGMFDPDQTSAGHQPLGYDQWTAMFNRYIVKKCHVTARVVTTASTVANMVVGLVCLNGVNSALSATQMTECVEGMRCRWHLLPQGPSATERVIKATFDLSKLTGASPVQYKSDDRYQALVSANPSEIVGLHLFAYDVTVSTNVDVAYVMRIEYECEFFDRVFPGQSLDRSLIHPAQVYRVLGTKISLPMVNRGQTSPAPLIETSLPSKNSTSSSSSSSVPSRTDSSPVTFDDLKKLFSGKTGWTEVDSCE